MLPAVLDLDEAIRARFAQAGVEVQFLTELPRSLVGLPMRSTSSSYAPSCARRICARDLDLIIAAGALGLRFTLDSRV